MLDISFYNPEMEGTMETIELSSNCYKSLDFWQITPSQSKNLKIDGELVKHDKVIPIQNTNRFKLSLLLRESIVKESQLVLERLKESFSKEEYVKQTYRLQKLHEILRCLENEQFTDLILD